MNKEWMPVSSMHGAPIMSGSFKQTVSLPLVFLLFLIVNGLYHFGLREQFSFAGFSTCMLEAALYSVILWVSVRCDLAKVTLCFLALPYLFFIPGWLNFPTAIVLSCIFLYCMKISFFELAAVHEKNITVRDIIAFIAIAMIVNISGAGGYGFQWADWNIHNGRLKDLVDYSWPVRYGKDQNFVYYFGYFILPAVIGKLTTLEIGIRSVYVWTLLGVALSVRWLGFLGRTHFTIALVLIFILFGPMDICNIIITIVATGNHIADVPFAIPGNLDSVDFTLTHLLPFFLGNYLSNTFNLYWSPQQVIAGWLCISLITHLYWQKKTRQLVFVYALLCLWGPLVMIAIFPFVLLTCLQQLISNPRDVLTIENILGSGALVIIFMFFYLGGSAGANPSFWIFSQLDSWGGLAVLCLLYLSGWGVYAIATSGYVLSQDSNTRCWFVCLIIALLILPLYIFGEWSDLLCRGSSPLMFLLLIFILRAAQHYREQQHPWRAILLICLLLPGMLSGFLRNYVSLQNYGVTQPVASIITYGNAYPNLGRDGTLFEKWFRRSINP